MRTTIRIDDGLLAAAKEHAARSGCTLTALIEDALREALARAAHPGPRRRVRLPVLRGSKFEPGVDLDDSAALLDLMEEGQWSFATSTSSSTPSATPPKTTRRTAAG